MQAGQAPIESAQSGRGGGNEDGGQAEDSGSDAFLFFSYYNQALAIKNMLYYFSNMFLYTVKCV